MSENHEARQALLKLLGEVNRQLDYFRDLGFTQYSDASKRRMKKPASMSEQAAGKLTESLEQDAARFEPLAATFETRPERQPRGADPGPSSAAPRRAATPEADRDVWQTGPAKSAARAAPRPMPLFADLTTASGESPMTSKRQPTSGPSQISLFGDMAPIESAEEDDLPNDETLEEIRADLGDCQRCGLHQSRTHIVFGEGNPEADLMFVGEGPGADEDATGRPFVGRAGRLLDRMIEAIGMRREDVYIGNIVKSRPPGNRAPEPGEIKACAPFLYRQINAVKPRLIVALGASAAKTLLQTKAPISKLRGRFFDFRNTKLLPTFHPAFLLRSPSKKKEAWDDLKKVRDFLQGKIPED